jgi:tetratricopeptide (TPR) repeat protein
MLSHFPKLLVLLLSAGAITLHCSSTPAFEADPINSALTGKRHSGGYNPHGKLPPDQLINVPLQHLQEGRPNDALHELDRGIVQYGTHAELFSVRGSLLLQMGRISEALRDFESALAINPDDPTTLTNRAETYRQLCRIEEALKDLDRTLTLNPDLHAARFNRGSIYYTSNKFDKAQVDFEQCIAIEPPCPGTLFQPRFYL